MNSPSVTVLMTVFNARPYLSASVRSILDQSFRDLEFLIIDDGSTDGSTDELRAWAQRDPRVRVIANTRNSGQTPCLNQGIAEARGVWIARQDADDISHPERLMKQMQALRERPALALLGCNGWLADASGRFQGLINAPCGESSVRWTAIFSNPFLHTAVCFRTADARQLGGYDPAFRIAQDYDLWLRIGAAAPGDNLPERLVTYRVHAQSLSNAARDATRREGEASCR
ncbi:MAG TPA: glycosyltransferase, partial [Terrimicrobiaceae bacterium]|nr:glycosyltransferase [Terrimicrobiaceae bacterium]